MTRISKTHVDRCTFHLIRKSTTRARLVPDAIGKGHWNPTSLFDLTEHERCTNLLSELGRLDFVYTFGDPSTLYLNVTNRCTNHCCFCVRRSARGLGGGNLWGGVEPDLDDLLEAIEEHAELSELDEIVWCGFGEPTFRLDLIREAGPIFRRAGPRVRLNTNGHACAIHGRDVLAELGESVDIVSVSLNAPNADRYVVVSQPRPEVVGLERASQLWDAMLSFLTDVPRQVSEVHASVVGRALDEQEIRASEELAYSLGCSDFRIR